MVTVFQYSCEQRRQPFHLNNLNWIMEMVLNCEMALTNDSQTVIESTSAEENEENLHFGMCTTGQ